MKKSIFTLIICVSYSWVQSQTTLQTVTTSGNTTTNAIRVTGETNITATTNPELVLGVLSTPRTNDGRTFIGWKNDAVTNPTTNGSAGTLLLQARSNIPNVPIDFVTGQGTPLLRMRIAGDGNVFIGTNNTSPGARLFVSGEGSTNSTTSLMVQNNLAIPALRVLDNSYVGVGNGISAAFPQSKLGIFSLAGDASGSDITLERWIHTGLIGGIRFASGYLNSASSNKPYWSGIEAYGTGGLDQMDLRFYTSVGPSQQNMERMRIDQFGRVGIGTATPAEKLSVGYGTNSDIAIGSSTNNKVYLSTFNNNAGLTINRRGSDGAFANPALPTASVNLITGSNNSYI